MSWPLAELNEVCSLITDGTHYTPPDIGNGIPFLTVKDVSDEGLDFVGCSKISSEEYKKADAGNSSPKRGDVLFSKDGTVGKVHVVKKDEKFAVLSSLAILRPGPNLDSGYLGHVLKSDILLSQASKNKTGSALRRIILSDIKKLKIPCPPISDQKRIAAILDKADAIRRKRQQAIQLADEFLRAVFLDMFGDPVTNPKGWEIASIHSLCEVQGGLQVTEKRNSNPLQRPYLRVANVLRNRLDLSEIKNMNVTEAECKRIELKRNDVLVVEGHGNKSEIGRCAVWNGEIEGILHQNHLIRIRVRDERIESRFLNDFINSSGGRIQMLGASNTTSGLNTISTNTVKDTEVFLPPISLQKMYVAITLKMAFILKEKSQSMKNIDDLFNALSQKAFSGQL